MWRFFLVFVYYSSIGLSLCIMNTICVFWGNKPMSRKERDEIKQTVQRKWWIAYHQHRSLQSLTNQNTYHIKSQRQTHKTIKHFRTVKSFSSLVGLVSSGEFRNVRMIVCVCVCSSARLSFEFCDPLHDLEVDTISKLRVYLGYDILNTMLHQHMAYE